MKFLLFGRGNKTKWKKQMRGKNLAWGHHFLFLQIGEKMGRKTFISCHQNKTTYLSLIFIKKNNILKILIYYYYFFLSFNYNFFRFLSFLHTKQQEGKTFFFLSLLFSFPSIFSFLQFFFPSY